MPYYRGTADRPDKVKALAGVAVVHVALAAVILSGLNVRTIGQAVERLKTFDIADPPPPPPIAEPPPKPDESSAPKDEAAPANLRSKPTPVVAPEPRIALPLPPKINTAEVKGPEGADRTAGASNVPGLGTGAGGQGNGFGGGGSGGSGSGDGRTPAQLIAGRLSNGDYRAIARQRLDAGSAQLVLRVNPNGRTDNCRVARSSGDRTIDLDVCGMLVKRLVFRPARDSDGRAIAQDIFYTATWRPR